MGLRIDQHGALAANAAAQHASQAEQGSAAANLTGLASTVADDFAIGAQNSFQERNGVENRFPSITVSHKNSSPKASDVPGPAKYLIVQEAEE